MSRQPQLFHGTWRTENLTVTLRGYPNQASRCSQDDCIDDVELESLEVLGHLIPINSVPLNLQKALVQDPPQPIEWTGPV